MIVGTKFLSMAEKSLKMLEKCLSISEKFLSFDEFLLREGWNLIRGAISVGISLSCCTEELFISGELLRWAWSSARWDSACLPLFTLHWWRWTFAIVALILAHGQIRSTIQTLKRWAQVLLKNCFWLVVDLLGLWMLCWLFELLIWYYYLMSWFCLRSSQWL